MSTQHPDNVKQPFFVENSIIAGEDEIKEAFYAFSHLKIKEQLWDCEGKEVDNFVVEKLLSRYEDYFRKNKIGKDLFITLRSPNPRVEKNKGKLLLETLESIPRNYDIAKQFYGEDIAPIFEVTIPMVSSANEVLRVKEYYTQFIIGKQHKITNDIYLRDWVGEFRPEQIKVIPLIEDKDSMLNADKIVEEYLSKTNEKDYQRVWLARSDPALNYGNLSAVLVNRIAFQRLYKLQEKVSVEILPIIGCGSVPFRGNFRPDNMQNILKAYPSVQTFTLQSAFKYDFPEEEVRAAVELLDNTPRKEPRKIDEERALKLIEKTSKEYQKQIALIAPLINQIANYVPQRRKRKMHIGLFGYSRDGSGVQLPRAIKFCASLYSLGLPPEILGLNVLNQEEYDFIHKNTGVEKDIKDALEFFNKENLSLFPDYIQEKVKEIIKKFDFKVNEGHKKVTSFIAEDFKKNNLMSMAENIERAASLRKFLG